MTSTMQWCPCLQKLIEELKAGSPAKENQPHSQQPQATATTGASPSTAPGPSKPVLAASRRNAQHSSAANRKAAMRRQLEVVFPACVHCCTALLHFSPYIVLYNTVALQSIYRAAVQSKDNSTCCFHDAQQVHDSSYVVEIVVTRGAAMVVGVSLVSSLSEEQQCLAVHESIIMLSETVIIICTSKYTNPLGKHTTAHV